MDEEDDLMLQRTLTALGTSALLGAALLIAPALTAAASGTFIASTITGGEEHTCALDTTGAAWCWGSNDYGQLGNGTYDDSDAAGPQAVAGGLRFISISAARDNTCGLTSIGAVYCWGENNEGQIGNGTSGPDQLTPTAVSGGLKFASISVGSQFTCALTSAGTAYCWGDPFAGELGNGSLTQKSTPTAVKSSLKFKSINAGYNQACALTNEGAAYCWGYNEYGSLGDGTWADRWIPTAVKGGLKFTSIDAGDDFTCALTASGAAYCWGDDYSGTLGTGAPGDKNIPKAVIGGQKFISISAGDDHSCALTATGSAYCWGENDTGELGDGTTDASSNLGPRAVLGGYLFASVTTNAFSGDLNHSCGITPEGDAYCWGGNSYGALGDGTTDPSYGNGPQLVLGGHRWMLDPGGSGCDRSSRGRERCRPTR